MIPTTPENKMSDHFPDASKMVGSPSPTPVSGKADEMPEVFKRQAADARPSAERHAGTHCHCNACALVAYADDRERLLARIEGLERSVKYYSGLTRHLDKDNASR